MDCKTWLRQLLRTYVGPAWYEMIRLAAVDEGFTRNEIREARKEIGALSITDSWTGREVRYWWLPDRTGEAYRDRKAN